MRVLIFIFVLLTAAPAFADASIFRNFVWGATKQDVRNFETARFYKEEGNTLFFIEQPDQFRRLIRYDFRDDKLWGARYEYQDLEDPNSEKIMNRYVDQELLLEKIYGAPIEEKFIWKNKLYRNHPQFWARALGDGDLRLEAVWQVNDTEITLQCFHDGVTYQLFYTLEVADKNAAPSGKGILSIPAPSNKP